MNDRHRVAQAMKNEAYRRLLDEAMTPSYFNRTAPPPRPLTRQERISRRLTIYSERIVLAWRVLRGDDIHEDC